MPFLAGRVIRLPVLLILVVHTWGPVVAQPQPPAVPSLPFPAANLAGHTAGVKALAFTPDGTRLCTAGLDKRVLVWKVPQVKAPGQPGRGPAGQIPPWSLLKTLRWEIEHARHGWIYALDPVVRQDRAAGWLAVAGFGGRGGLGEIVWLDPVDGSRPAAEFLQSGHRQAVAALDHTTDGVWLASADLHGRVLLRRTGAKEPPYQLQAADVGLLPGQEAPPLRPVAAIGEDLVATPEFVEMATFANNQKLPAWDVALYDLKALEKMAGDGQVPNIAKNPAWQAQTDGRLKRRARIRAYGFVTALAASPDGRYLAAADLAYQLFIWDRETDEATLVQKLPRPALSLQFAPNSRLLVAGLDVTPPAKPSEQPAAQIRVLRRTDQGAWQTLWSDPQASRTPLTACAISPDGRLLAHPGGQGRQVVVRSLATSQIQETLDGGGVVLAASFAAGQKPKQYEIQFTTQRAGKTTKRIFRPTELEVEDLPQTDQPAESATTQEPPPWAAGRTVSRSGQQVSWSVGGKKIAAVSLDRLQQGRPTCHCWVPEPPEAERTEAERTEAGPVALAVGTAHGVVFLYDAQSGQMRRTFEGHIDTISSVQASADGRYLVSAAADGTVRIWSLTGLSDPLRLQSIWGARFQQKMVPDADGRQVRRVVFAEVDDSGPLYRKGVRPGDVIESLAWFDERDQKQVISKAQAIQEQLSQAPWQRQITFQIQREGQQRPLMQQRPTWPEVLALYADQRDWIVWHPTGYYAASVLGDRIMGWQINFIEQNKPPEFYTAERFFKSFYRPAAIKKLLPLGSLREALATSRPPAQALPPPPPPPAPPPPEAPNQPPKISLKTPDPPHALLGKRLTDVIAEITPEEKLRDVRLLLNGDRVLQAPDQQRNRFQWRLSLPPGLTRLSVRAVNTDGETTTAETTVERQTNQLQVRPPSVTILQPQGREFVAQEDTIEVTAQAGSNSEHPIRSMEILINGRVPQSLTKAHSRQSKQRTETWKVALEPGLNHIQVRAKTAASSNVSDVVTVSYSGVPRSKPTLWVLAVGISRYPGPLALQFADRDAQRIQEVFASQAPNLTSGLYDVKTRLLTDRQATKDAIKQGWQWLKENVQDGDVGMFFFSGHGEREGQSGSLYLLPADVKPDNLAETALSQKSLSDFCSDMSNKGHLIVMLDACRSGAITALNRQRGLELDETARALQQNYGTVVVASCRGAQFSYEANPPGSGFFTHAVVERLRGAELRPGRPVSHFSLYTYVYERVKELSRQRNQTIQEPILASPDMMVPITLTVVPTAKTP